MDIGVQEIAAGDPESIDPSQARSEQTRPRWRQHEPLHRLLPKDVGSATGPTCNVIGETVSANSVSSSPCEDSCHQRKLCIWEKKFRELGNEARGQENASGMSDIYSIGNIGARRVPARVHTHTQSDDNTWALSGDARRLIILSFNPPKNPGK